jgi:hypothetical protein
VTDSGINFKPGRDRWGVQVVLTAKSSTVSGSVTDARSQPSPTTRRSSSRKTARSGLHVAYVHMARPDQQGAFQ